MTTKLTYKRFWRTMATAFAIMLFSACYEQTIYNCYQHTNIDGWEKSEELHYPISPVEEAGTYQQYIGIRLTDLYPFQTLSLIVQQTVYPDKRTFSDTLNCEVIDEQGNLIGNGLNISQYEKAFKTISLKKGDSLAISIRHNMRRERLEGISDIGFKMETTIQE